MAVKIKGVWVRVLEPGLLQVQSFSNPEKWYVVDRKERTCTCPDFKNRGRKCKHLQFVEEHEWKIELEEKIWKANKEFEEWRKKQLTLPQFFSQGRRRGKMTEEELLKLQEKLGVYAWILFGE